MVVAGVIHNPVAKDGVVVMKPSWRITIFSLGYWYSSRSLGLLLHPYVTMQTIVREHFLRPLVFLPMIVWLSSWVVGFLLFQTAKILPLAIITNLLFLKPILAFAWWWATLFLVWWQLVLGYLYLRFRLAFR